MKNTKLVPMMISLPKEYRDKLRTMAAEQNLKNLDQVTSGATIAKEIICDHLKNIPPDGLERESKNVNTKRKEETMT